MPKKLKNNGYDFSYLPTMLVKIFPVVLHRGYCPLWLLWRILSLVIWSYSNATARQHILKHNQVMSNGIRKWMVSQVFYEDLQRL